MDEDDDFMEDDEEALYEGDQSFYEDLEFADPGGNSALRAASETNPRNQPCPTCHEENVLTPKDVAKGYQCDRCADEAEGRCWPRG